MEVRYASSSPSELFHHGIKGQKWGIRRYQNPDGTLTEEGRRRFGTVAGLEKVQRKKKVLGAGFATAAAFAGATTAISRHYGNLARAGEAAARSANMAKRYAMGGARYAEAARYRSKQATAETIGVIGFTGALAVSTFIASDGHKAISQFANKAIGKNYADQAIIKLEDEKINKK